MKLLLGIVIGVVLTLGLGWVIAMIWGYKAWERS